MAEDDQKVKRVFISYSWTSPAHEQWVVDLAERLMSDGIDVVLDKWELTEGQDKYAYMEKMVTDSTINKVLAICDKRYAEKADGREGGVGTESQIISREVYESVDQKKFIPVVTEFDEQGRPCLSAFFQSRIYIDMFNREKEIEEYEKLIRNIYDKPLYKKPTRGKMPSYILEADRIPSKTFSKLQAFKDAVMKGRATVVNGLAADYLDHFSETLEDFRIDTAQNDIPLDERVRASINQFLPHRDEFIDFLIFAIRYANQVEIHEEIHRNFERMLQYIVRPNDGYWDERLTDNYHFILRELFLYLIAALIKKEKSTELEIYLGRPYFYWPFSRESANSYVTYTIFDPGITSLDQDRPRRLNLNDRNVSAELIHRYATNVDLDFNMLMQTDFILGLRSTFHNEGSKYDYWWPRTMVYAKRYKRLDLFAKAESSRYFDFLKRLLKVESKDDLIEKFKTKFDTRSFQFSSSIGSIGFESIMNFDNLDTRP